MKDDLLVICLWGRSREKQIVTPLMVLLGVFPQSQNRTHMVVSNKIAEKRFVWEGVKDRNGH